MRAEPGRLSSFSWLCSGPQICAHPTALSPSLPKVTFPPLFSSFPPSLPGGSESAPRSAATLGAAEVFRAHLSACLPGPGRRLSLRHPIHPSLHPPDRQPPRSPTQWVPGSSSQNGLSLGCLAPGIFPECLARELASLPLSLRYPLLLGPLSWEGEAGQAGRAAWAWGLWGFTGLRPGWNALWCHREGNESFFKILISCFPSPLIPPCHLPPPPSLLRLPHHKK